MDKLIKASISANEFPENSDRWSLVIKAKIFLNNLITPEIQRDLDEEWSNGLEQRLKKEYEKSGYFDIDRIYVVCYDSKLYIVNGQHRVRVLKSLIKDDPEIQIEVRLVSVETEQERDEYYAACNKSRPSCFIEADDADEINTLKIINGIAKHFRGDHPEYMSTSRRPHRPNINIDVIQEKFTESKFVSRIPGITLEVVVNKIEELNLFYKNTSNSQFSEWGVKDSAKLKNMCTKRGNLYLGMFSKHEWVERIIQALIYERKFNSFSHNITGLRVKIPKITREKVWRKHGISLIGSCFCCENVLDHSDFECGHVISAFHGGKSSFTNLEPVCKTCNQDMGTQNMTEYKQKFV